MDARANVRRVGAGAIAATDCSAPLLLLSRSVTMAELLARRRLAVVVMLLRRAEVASGG